MLAAPERLQSIYAHFENCLANKSLLKKKKNLFAQRILVTFFTSYAIECERAQIAAQSADIILPILCSLQFMTSIIATNMDKHLGTLKSPFTLTSSHFIYVFVATVD